MELISSILIAILMVSRIVYLNQSITDIYQIIFDFAVLRNLNLLQKEGDPNHSFRMLYLV